MNVWHPLLMPQVSRWLEWTGVAKVSGIDNPRALARHEVRTVLLMSGALPSEIESGEP